MTSFGAGFIILRMKKTKTSSIIALLIAGLLLTEAPLAYPKDKVREDKVKDRGRGSAQVAPPVKPRPQKRRLDGYGEKRPVRGPEEARRTLEKFYGEKGLWVGSIKERELLFEAEVLDRNNKLVDKVIIDKRTGRIRSIY